MPFFQCRPFGNGGAKLAGEGRFSVPVARTFAFEEWREALDLSLSGHARGKLVLFPAGATARG
jgi:hypothetical protein